MRLNTGCKIGCQHPLHPEIFLPLSNLNDLWISLKYEKLATFCYNCGIIGHDDSSCIGKTALLCNPHGHYFKASEPWLRAESEDVPPDVHVAPSPSPPVVQAPDVRIDASTIQNLTKIQLNETTVVKSGVSPTAEGSASSAPGQFLAALSEPKGTVNALPDALSHDCIMSKVRPTSLQQHTSDSLSPIPPLTSSLAHFSQDPITPTYNTGPIGTPRSLISPALARIEPYSITTSPHFDTSNTSSSSTHLSNFEPSSLPPPIATTQIFQDSNHLKRKITNQELAHFAKRLKKTINESEVVYFDSQTETFIPLSRLEYFILEERDKPNTIYSPKIRGKPLKSRTRNVSAISTSITVSPKLDSSSFFVPMAEEAGLIKPLTSP